jgi:hypothetical protein
MVGSRRRSQQTLNVTAAARQMPVEIGKAKTCALEPLIYESSQGTSE